jgi:hypothetical protein
MVDRKHDSAPDSLLVIPQIGKKTELYLECGDSSPLFFFQVLSQAHG